MFQYLKINEQWFFVMKKKILYFAFSISVLAILAWFIFGGGKLFLQKAGFLRPTGGVVLTADEDGELIPIEDYLEKKEREKNNEL